MFGYTAWTPSFLVRLANAYLATLLDEYFALGYS